MRKLGVFKGKGGRPRLGLHLRKRHQVMLDPEAAQQLRLLGQGNLSRGIARAAETAMKINQLENQNVSSIYG